MKVSRAVRSGGKGGKLRLLLVQTLPIAIILYNGDLYVFNADYLKYTAQVAKSCENRDLTDSMVIGTSAITDTEIDGAVGMYSGVFNNPFMIWGKYKKKWCKTFLTVSFQFHHTQMDGAHAGEFLENLQNEIISMR